MTEEQYEYGMIGLGTMGSNLVLNMNDHGYSVAGYDKDKAQVDRFIHDTEGRKIRGFGDLKAFVSSLKTPRVILLLVPAGRVVDSVIAELRPFLGQGDLLMDCGNSHFVDTATRIEELSKQPFHFMGTGISGGESGARNGPSIMPGGAREDYRSVGPMLEAIAAKVQGQPCVSWLGPGAAGHYVKMVHNGIEYGLMQLISEAYHLLKVAGQMTNDDMHQIFSQWNQGILKSYLVGITADIFLQEDDLSGERLIDLIRDSAAQKGTGAWTSEDASVLQVPVPVIDTAVSMRDLSAAEEDRARMHTVLKNTKDVTPDTTGDLATTLEKALYFAMITTYAQGMSLLKSASIKYNYDLHLDEVARIWRGGCIIRAAVLEDIRAAFQGGTNTDSLMLNGKLAGDLLTHQEGIRSIVQLAARSGIPAPAFMASLSYFDSFRSGWLPANLIQAQRDCFGAHTYRRKDREGTFHTEWNTKQD